MTIDEARVLLKFAPNTSDPSKVNSALSEQHLVEMLSIALEHQAAISAPFEKRIMQAVQNRKRPHTVWKTS